MLESAFTRIPTHAQTTFAWGRSPAIWFTFNQPGGIDGTQTTKTETTESLDPDRVGQSAASKTRQRDGEHPVAPQADSRRSPDYRPDLCADQEGAREVTGTGQPRRSSARPRQRLRHPAPAAQLVHWVVK